MTEGHLSLLKFCSGDECLLETAEMPGPPPSVFALSQCVHHVSLHFQMMPWLVFDEIPQSRRYHCSTNIHWGQYLCLLTPGEQLTALVRIKSALVMYNLKHRKTRYVL